MDPFTHELIDWARYPDRHGRQISLWDNPPCWTEAQFIAYITNRDRVRTRSETEWLVAGSKNKRSVSGAFMSVLALLIGKSE